MSDAADRLTEDDVLDALSNVIDPELGLDFVELGLIYGVELPSGDVKVTFTLTTPACPIGPQVTEQIEEFVGELDGVETVSSEMVFTPPWSPERMSEDAKFALGLLSRRLELDGCGGRSRGRARSASASSSSMFSRDHVDVRQGVEVAEQAEVHLAVVGHDRDRQRVVLGQEGHGDRLQHLPPKHVEGELGAGDVGDDQVEQPGGEVQPGGLGEDRRRGEVLGAGDDLRAEGLLGLLQAVHRVARRSAAG